MWHITGGVANTLKSFDGTSLHCHFKKPNMQYSLGIQNMNRLGAAVVHLVEQVSFLPTATAGAWAAAA